MTIQERFYDVYTAFPGRIPHVEGVKTWSEFLAEKNGVDPDQMAQAAYLHDLTKYESDGWHLALFDKSGVPAWKALPPFMYHGYSASLIAAEYGLDQVFIDAVKHHTTGRANMQTAEKILMLADKIEPSRPYPEAATLRDLATHDLEAAFKAMLHHLYGFDQTHGRLNAYNYETYAFYIPERVAE